MNRIGRFEHDGFLFFPSLFRSEEVKVLTEEVPRLYAQDRPENVARERQRRRAHQLRRAQCTGLPFAKLAHHPRLVEPIVQLFGEDVYMHQFKIHGKLAFDGDVWQWHQDYGTWKNDDLNARGSRDERGDIPR